MDSNIFVSYEDEYRLEFKKFMKEPIRDILIGAFSSLPARVVCLDDIQKFIDVQIEEYDNVNFIFFEDSLSRENLHSIVELGHKGLDIQSEFSMIIDEVVNIILSRIHDDCIWFDKLYQIRKKSLKAIINLCLDGTIHAKKSIRNKEVEALVGVTRD